MKRVLLGHFAPGELRRYVALKTAVFWGIIAACWVAYPDDHHYSIMSHTFSFLGSFSDDRNPQWWWLFTIAMVFWSVSMIPLVFYVHRRFVPVSRVGAAIGAGFFLLGSISIGLVGIFPDVSTPLIGELQWTEVHEKVAILVAIGFLLGIIWHAGLIAHSRFFARVPSGLRHRLFVAPYLIWSGTFATAAYFQISWDIQYRALKDTAAARGEKIGSSWAESLNTIYAFPLWENVVIYTLFLFVVWFVLILPHEPGRHSVRDEG